MTHTHAHKPVIVPSQPIGEPPVWVRWLRKMIGKPVRNRAVWKGKDGLRHMLIITSNAYEDREGETITSEALRDWVARQWDGDTYVGTNPLLFWHDDRIVMGEIIFSDMAGAFLIEIARELNEYVAPLAPYLWDYAETATDMGASHAFMSTTDADDDTVFVAIEKFETSYLPRESAANALTYAGVIDVDKGELFDKVIGLSGASDLLENGVEVLVEALQKQGVMHKAKRSDAEMHEAILSEIAHIAQNLEGKGTDMKKSKETQERFGRLLALYNKMYGTVDETLKDEATDMLEEAVEAEVVDITADDALALVTEHLMNMGETLTVLVDEIKAMRKASEGVALEDALIAEEEAMKSRLRSRQANRPTRASQADSNVIDLDSAPDEIKSWAQPTETFFGRTVKGRK